MEEIHLREKISEDESGCSKQLQLPTIWHNCSHDVTQKKNAVNCNFHIDQVANEKKKKQN